MKRGTLRFKPPELGETRQAGWAVISARPGYTVREESCLVCATVLGVPWIEGLFEGECVGCEVPLSGAPNSH